VSRPRYLVPISQKVPARSIIRETIMKAKFMLVCPAIQPMSGGEMASPRA
jgi:hypothetical protein